jgi:DNA polymerase III delta prime subunit
MGAMMEVPGSAIRESQWDERTKQLAYEVYSKRAGGDMRAALAILSEPAYPNIPEKTVYDWRSRYRWDARLEEERRGIAPILWERYTRELSVAAPEAVSYLRSVLADDTANVRDRITAARSLMQQYASHAEALLAAIPAPVSQVSSDISTEELVALAAGDRGAGEGGSGEG